MNLILSLALPSLLSLFMSLCTIALAVVWVSVIFIVAVCARYRTVHHVLRVMTTSYSLLSFCQPTCTNSIRLLSACLQSHAFHTHIPPSHDGKGLRGTLDDQIALFLLAQEPHNAWLALGLFWAWMVWFNHAGVRENIFVRITLPAASCNYSSFTAGCKSSVSKKVYIRSGSEVNNYRAGMGWYMRMLSSGRL